MLVRFKGLMQKLLASLTLIFFKFAQGLKIYSSLLDVMVYNILGGIK